MYAKVKEKLLQLHRDERGAMSTEMMLILAIVAIPVLILLYKFGQLVIGWFSEKQTDLESNH